ncbi:hypothetical protein [Bacillus sp. 166amftsu]|uniref:hypothetical protein n=1 Tax=Bacillus sp. 166amftsu TaxID=1761753 RepID=UPI000895B38D|nr:hypothetical protein [Bacillus sp. 166amftsu]SDY43468.1 hypothetical protein SAMN04488156_101378 [Bacillus sp. 166amftsu]
MKTYEELVEKCKELINKGWTPQAVYECFEAYSEWGPDSIQHAINEALGNDGSGFSDNVLDHRPNLENLKAIGKEDDYVFQALAYMGHATHFMSWANTVLELVEEVPEGLKEEIKKVHSSIWEMQEKLREFKKDEQ